MSHIYCAGPLFNTAERGEMAAIADALEEAGHTTFLPHRDGLEFAQLQPILREQGLSIGEAEQLLEKVIFSLDVYLVLNRVDAVVANLNGRVPDEGMIVEVTLAWHSNKPVVFYKSDARSLLFGSDNPLLRGLAQFEVVTSIPEIPAAVERRFQVSQKIVETVCSLGGDIERICSEQPHKAKLAQALFERLHS